MKPPAHRTLVTVSVMIAAIMQMIDTTVANVALPTIQGALSASQNQIAWVLTSYIVALTIMTPATGVLSVRIGRKRVLLLTVAGFTLFSMLCGAAQTLGELVLFRIMQGVCGASLVPLSQAVLLDAYPHEQHGSAMAIWGTGIMIGPILGPTLGGYLTEYYSWRWVFYVNLPIGILAFLGLLAFLPETEKEPDRPFDYFGFLMLGLAIGALQLMLDRGESQGWFNSTEIVAEAAAFGFCLYLFVVHMFTTDRPFIEPRLLKDTNFVLGQVFIFFSATTFYASMALMPPFLQNLMGFPALTAGYVLAPRSVGTMFSMFIVGRLIRHVDARILTMIGSTTLAFSLWEMSNFTTAVSTWTVVHTGIVQGFGLGLIFVPLSTLTFATLDPRYRTEGTAVYSLLRSLGSSIGVTTVFTLLARWTQVNHAGLSTYVTPFSAFALPPAWSIDNGAGLAVLNAEINRQAATIAAINDFKLMTYLTVLIMPLLLLWRLPAKAGSLRRRRDQAVQA